MLSMLALVHVALLARAEHLSEAQNIPAEPRCTSEDFHACTLSLDNPSTGAAEGMVEILCYTIMVNLTPP